MPAERPAVTILFSDIEGSTRLWEEAPERMQAALAWHDALAKANVTAHGGRVVKTTGDGIHAVFDSPLGALNAALGLQLALCDAEPTTGLRLAVRCGLHAGMHFLRDGDVFGPTVNRAARIMSIAHGGQTLLSQVVVDLLAESLPPDVSLQDLGRVRLRDLTAPERVHQLRHPRLRGDFPPLRSLESTPNNLVQQLDSFVGREREMAETRQRLASSRLLTLLGMGGIGKSRLSVQLGAEVLDDFADGVWFVELAPLTDPRLVPQALASVLGVKEEAGHEVAESLVKHARDRQLLVVLDNCEHLVEACAKLAKQLLQAGAGVKVLATSRDALKVAGEAIYAVPTLSVPAAEESLVAATLTRHEGVRLFVDRVMASQPGFAVTERNMAAVADICQRLDGIPLAIELAAARTRTLSVEAIATRLGDRFRLLGTRDLTVAPRQRTLRALIDWSHDLLSDAEQVLFRRLAVFAGGWTIEAAEGVGSGDGIEVADVVQLLGNLVEKSLVVMELGGERYRMLDTVRHYALERLAASGDEAGARDRHLKFYLELAEEARASLSGANQKVWLARLDQDRENLMGAHARCDAQFSGASELGLRLVYALRPYWLNRGLLGLGYQLTVEALQRKGAEKRDLFRCSGLSDAGWLAYFMGRYAVARKLLQESLDISRDIDDVKSVAVVLQPLGMACLGVGDVVAATAYLEEGVELAQSSGNKRELAAAVNSLAQLHRTSGHPASAELLYEKGLALARNISDDEYVAGFLLNLAMVSVRRRPSDSICAMLMEVLRIAADIGSKPAVQSAFEVCAGLAAALDEWEFAARFFGIAESQAAATGLQRDPADEAFLMALIFEAKTSLGATEFAALEAAGRTVPFDAAVIEVRTWLTAKKPASIDSVIHERRV